MIVDGYNFGRFKPSIEAGLAELGINDG